LGILPLPKTENYNNRSRIEGEKVDQRRNYG
jgi:hypothetical protein